jgi:hypothetical protein
MKEYVVFTWTLANQLYKRGFKVIGTRLDYKNPSREVILFEDTPALRAAIQEIALAPK